MTDWPTTRRFPRTLQEAFPYGEEYAQSVFKCPTRPLNYSDGVTVVCTIIVAFMTVFAYVHA